MGCCSSKTTADVATGRGSGERSEDVCTPQPESGRASAVSSTKDQRNGSGGRRSRSGSRTSGSRTSRSRADSKSRADSRAEIGLALHEGEGEEAIRILDESLKETMGVPSPPTPESLTAVEASRPSRPHRMSVKMCDWELEAGRLARNESFEYGNPPDGLPTATASLGSRASAVGSRASTVDASPAVVYTITGHNYNLWTRATESERLSVVQAFEVNATVQRVEMVNALVSDVLGQAWGDVLKRNTTLTTLNLESNAIST
eukprot:3142708-Prymnesium_polylepis.1